MPAVTVPPRPNGLPIAITHSPGRTAAESPRAMNGSFWSVLIFSTAMSVRGSVPITRAGSSVPSDNVTLTEEAFLTT